MSDTTGRRKTSIHDVLTLSGQPVTTIKDGEIYSVPGVLPGERVRSKCQYAESGTAFLVSEDDTRPILDLVLFIEELQNSERERIDSLINEHVKAKSSDRDLISKALRVGYVELSGNWISIVDKPQDN